MIKLMKRQFEASLTFRCVHRSTERQECTFLVCFIDVAGSSNERLSAAYLFVFGGRCIKLI